MRTSQVVRASVGLAALLVSSGVLASDKSGTRPTMLSVPRGPGSVEGLGEAFQVNLNTGSATETIVLKLPPGTGGMTPKLSLAYDSGRGNGAVGLGWGLGLSSIQRQTEKGLPHYDSTDHLLWNGAELAEVSTGVWRLKDEGRFIRVRRSGAGFEVDLPNGTVQRYGMSPESRVEAGAQVAAWYLEDEVDPLGNRIGWFYEKDGALPWLVRVEYNRRPGAAQNVVELRWETRPDALTDYHFGFRTTVARRLSRVLVSAGGTLLRRYALEYEGGTGLSRLHTVTLVGSDGATALPPVTLGWSSFRPQGRHPATMPGAPAALPGSSPDTEVVDMDGDGFPDLLTAALGQHRWARNVGGKSFATPVDLASSPSVNLGTAGVELGDIDGDGLPDLIARTGTTPSAFRYFPGTGKAGWKPSVTFSGNPSIPVEDGTTRFVDLDLDHRPDAFRLTASSATWWRNVGDGSWAAPVSVPLPGSTTVLELADPRVKLADMNGDRVMDLVFVRSGSVTCWPGMGNGLFDAPVTWGGAPNVGTASEAKLQLADLSGDGLSDLVLVDVDHVDVWLATPQATFEAPVSIANTPSANATLTQVRFADMNGNGSVDIVWFTPSAAPDARVQVLDLQDGVRPNVLTSVSNGLGLVRTFSWTSSSQQYQDALEAGHPWTTVLPFPVQVIARATTSDSMGPVAATAWTYANGYFDGVRRELRGFGQVTERVEGDDDEPTLVATHEYDLGLSSHCLQGRELSTERRSSDGKRFDRLEWDVQAKAYATALDGSDIEGAVVLEERRFIDEGTGAPVKVVQQWSYDDWGNPKHALQAGRVEGTKLDAGADESVTDRVFINDPTRWLIGLLQEESVSELSGVVVGRTRRFYDGEPFVGLPAGSATRGLLTREEAWVEGSRWIPTSRVARDEYGNVTATLSPTGARRDVTYDEATHTWPVSEKAWLTSTTSLDYSLTWIGQTGLVESYTDSNGAVTHFAYDPLQRMTALAKPGDSLERPTLAWIWSLGSPLSALSTIVRHGPGPDDVTRSFSISDGFGRTLETIHQAEGGRWVVGGRKKYSLRGSVVKEWDAFFADTSDFVAEPSTSAVRKRYDALGRIVETTFVDGTRSEIRYGPLWKETWDAEDLDPASPHASTPFRVEDDGQGRTVASIEALGADRLTTRFAWNAAGQGTGYTTSGGVQAVYVLDGMGRLTSATHPDTGTRRYEYDDDGNLHVWHDAQGQQRVLDYDALGRTLADRLLDATGAEVSRAEYHYDAPSPKFADDPASPGNLTWVRDAAGEEHFRYDERRRLVENVRGVSSKSFHLAHAYDAADRLTRLTYPDGFELDYSYNERGFVSAVAGIISSVEYDAGGLATKRTYSNGIVTQASYDAHERVSGISTRTPDGKTVQALGYGYDKAGTLTSITDGVTSSGPKSAAWSFVYDDLYRLKDANGAAKSVSHQYDGVGNLLQKSDLGAYAYPASGGELPNAVRAVGGRTLEWNPNGTLARFDGRQYEWNPAAQLTRVTTEKGITEYVYDYTGQRAVKRVRASGKDEETLYLDKFVEQRGGQLIKNVYLGDARVARIGGGLPKAVEVAAAAMGPGAALAALAALLVSLGLSGLRRRKAATRAMAAFLAFTMTSCSCGPKDGPPEGTVFFAEDHLGSATLVFDASGKLSGASNFDPWGAALAATEEPYGFLGSEYDVEAGLQYLGNRYYDPRLGRFISPDLTILGRPDVGVSDPQQLNLYSYARNTPTSLLDKTGKLPHILIGALVGGVVGLAAYSIKAAVNGEEFDGRAALAATASGVVAGAVGAATLGVGLIASGAVAGAAGGIVERGVRTGDVGAAFDPKAIVTDAAIGGATAGVFKGLSVAGSKISGAVSRRSGSAVAEAVESGKQACTGGKCGVPGGQCFVAGTPIQLSDGRLVPIEQVQEGDWVVAASDDGKGPLGAGRVARTFVRDTSEVVDVDVGHGDGTRERITTTVEHPFLVEIDGARQWIAAGNLKAGMPLVGSWGIQRVEAIGVRTQHTRVYNFEVEGMHAYGIGVHAVQVHNAPCGATSEGTVRVRHFTNSKGVKGIETDGVIKASDQNKVFTVKAQGKPGSPRDVEEALGIKRGRGNNYVEFDAKPSEFQTVKNARTEATETVFDGDVALSGRNATFNNNR